MPSLMLHLKNPEASLSWPRYTCLPLTLLSLLAKYDVDHQSSRMKHFHSPYIKKVDNY